MDYLQKLKGFIESIEGVSVFLESKDGIDLGAMTDGVSICLVPAPSGNMTVYLDRSKSKFISFQILSRHPDQLFAYDILSKIANELQSAGTIHLMSDNESFKFINCTISSEPNYLEKSNHGWTYTSMFTSDLFIKNKE